MAKSQFTEAIAATTGQELTGAGFRQDALSSGGDYCVYVKRRSEKTALYVLARDTRPKGGNVRVDLWLAPIQPPDDSIVVCGLGLRLTIFNEYEVDDTIMLGVGRKIVAVVPGLTAFTEVVEREIEHPYIETRPLPWFRCVNEVRRVLKQSRDRRVQAEIGRLEEQARRLTSGTGELASLEQACEKPFNMGIDHGFSEVVTRWSNEDKARALAEALYSHAAVE